MRRTAYITANLAKNALAPVVIPFRRGRGCFGIDGDLDAVCDVLDRLAGTLASLNVVLEGKRILELGVGRTGEVSAATVLAGAAHAHGVDIDVQLDNDADCGSRYAALTTRLADGGAAAFLAAVGGEAETVKRRAAELGAGRWPLRFETYAGVKLPIDDGSVDVVLSKSVLEHVRREKVRPLLTDLRRVLRPGGVMVHIIDLRDHMFIVGDREVRGDWLDALRYSDRLFDAMFGNRSTSINRLRQREWRVAFGDAGLDVVSEDATVFGLPDGFNSQRLYRRYRTMPESELRVGFLTVGARRPPE